MRNKKIVKICGLTSCEGALKIHSVFTATRLYFMKCIKFFTFFFYCLTPVIAQDGLERDQINAIMAFISLGVTVVDDQGDKLVVGGGKDAISNLTTGLSQPGMFKTYFPKANPFSVKFQDVLPDSWSSFLGALELKPEDAGYIQGVWKDENGCLTIDCTRPAIGLMAQGYIACLLENRAMAYFVKANPGFIEEKKNSGVLTEIVIRYAHAAKYFVLPTRRLGDYEPTTVDGDWVEVGATYVEIDREALLRRLTVLNGSDIKLAEYLRFDDNYRIARVGGKDPLCFHQIMLHDGTWKTVNGKVRLGETNVSKDVSATARLGLDGKPHAMRRVVLIDKP